MVWGIQAAMLLGLWATIVLNPLRWIRPGALYASTLRSWLYPWLLFSFFASWKASEPVFQLAQRLSRAVQAKTLFLVVLLVALLNMAPWLLATGLLVSHPDQLALLCLAGKLGCLALGPALAVGLSSAREPERLAGTLALILTWTLWGTARAGALHDLLAWGALVGGWVLVGFAFRETQPMRL